MRRYICFGGEFYYAGGGMSDYRGDAEDWDECEMILDPFIEKEWGRLGPDTWAQVLDVETGKVRIYPNYLNRPAGSYQPEWSEWRHPEENH
jgi:hypothetical protein